MEIETQELTACEVAPDGCAISLGFIDSKGEPATIRLSVNQVGALIMTLPGLISKALQTRFGDQSLRYAYPLDSWVIEQSTDPKHGMMTLRTSDGFSVCFSIPREQQSELGEALTTAPASRASRCPPGTPCGRRRVCRKMCPTNSSPHCRRRSRIRK